MKLIHVVMILCAVAPTFAVAKEAPSKTKPAHVARKMPAPADVWLPGVLRQDLFDRNNPNNLRDDYPGPPAQPAQL